MGELAHGAGAQDGPDGRVQRAGDDPREEEGLLLEVAAGHQAQAGKHRQRGEDAAQDLAGDDAGGEDEDAHAEVGVPEGGHPAAVVVTAAALLDPAHRHYFATLVLVLPFGHAD